MGAEERQAAEGMRKAVKLKVVNRRELLLRAVDVEKLIEPEKLARTIWELMGRLALRGLRGEIE